jgi:hypothetical protein
MQTSVERPRPAKSPPTHPHTRTYSLRPRKVRLESRPAEPFGPSYGCVEWFDYSDSDEESRQFESGARN